LQHGRFNAGRAEHTYIYITLLVVELWNLRCLMLGGNHLPVAQLVQSLPEEHGGELAHLGLMVRRYDLGEAQQSIGILVGLHQLVGRLKEGEEGHFISHF